MRLYLVGAGLHGAMGVAMGAWASHGLPGTLDPAAIEWVRTGASYQLWHAAALIGLAAAAHLARTRLIALAGLGMGLGALVFSGSLYLYALAGISPLAMLAPVGGVMMIAGWLALIGAGFRFRSN
jgi:uncharacterized membrane protein YgdD (TMEM256/DUF423 family)